MVIEKFEVHRGLMKSLIKNQGGDIQKAVMEAVMNSIDAGSGSIEVNLCENGFSVTDNGRGLGSAEDIAQFFRVFGMPHDEGDAKFGRFRMGRGQIMYFGRSTWRSGHTRIDVDIEDEMIGLGGTEGFGYKAVHDLTYMDGCSVMVELFAPLDQSSTIRLANSLNDHLEFSPIPITVNWHVAYPSFEDFDREAGKLNISHGVTSFEIGEDVARKKRLAQHGAEVVRDDEDFLIMRRPAASKYLSNTALFNQGILVSAYHTLFSDVSGSWCVVSRKALELNMARTEVMPHCPRLQELRRIASAEAKKDRWSLEKDDISSLAHAFARFLGTETDDLSKTENQWRTLNFFRDTQGRRYRMSHILKPRRSIVPGLQVILVPVTSDYSGNTRHQIDKLSRAGVTVLDKNTGSALVDQTVIGALAALQNRSRLETDRVATEALEIILRKAFRASYPHVHAANPIDNGTIRVFYGYSALARDPVWPVLEKAMQHDMEVVKSPTRQVARLVDNIENILRFDMIPKILWPASKRSGIVSEKVMSHRFRSDYAGTVPYKLADSSHAQQVYIRSLPPARIFLFESATVFGVATPHGIGLNIDLLKNALKSVEGSYQLMHTLQHELAHYNKALDALDCAEDGVLGHDPEFFIRFHDLGSIAGGGMIHLMDRLRELRSRHKNKDQNAE